MVDEDRDGSVDQAESPNVTEAVRGGHKLTLMIDVNFPRWRPELTLGDGVACRYSKLFGKTLSKNFQVLFRPLSNLQWLFDCSHRYDDDFSFPGTLLCTL